MSAAPSILLHLGAPHCGAALLQRSLSAAPQLPSTDGAALLYTALKPGGRGWSLLSGKSLQQAALRAPEGRMSWPETAEDPAPLYDLLDRLRRKPPGGGVPLVSAPGWIDQAETLSRALPHWFAEAAPGGKVEICAFLRPPLDWLNAAWWAEGVWTGRSFGAWLVQAGISYRLGAALTRWAALPNTELRLGFSENVLGAFDGAYGTRLPRFDRGTEGDLPPALLGFLLRHPRHRGGDGQVAPAQEVFRRWCRVEDAPRAWAVLPRHLSLLGAEIAADLDQLMALIPEEGAEALCRADPRWNAAPDPYEALFLRGQSPLDDAEEMAGLYRALVKGVAAAAEAAGKRLPPLQPVLATRAPVHSWDVALAHALGQLAALDRDHRQGRRLFGF